MERGQMGSDPGFNIRAVGAVRTPPPVQQRGHPPWVTYFLAWCKDPGPKIFDPQNIKSAILALFWTKFCPPPWVSPPHKTNTHFILGFRQFPPAPPRTPPPRTQSPWSSGPTPPWTAPEYNIVGVFFLVSWVLPSTNPRRPPPNSPPPLGPGPGGSKLAIVQGSIQTRGSLKEPPPGPACCMGKKNETGKKSPPVFVPVEGGGAIQKLHCIEVMLTLTIVDPDRKERRLA